MAILTERGLDEGLIEQLRQAGPEAAATVRGLVDASYYELEALNYAFSESTRVAVESMQRELDPYGVAESAEELIDKVALTILENPAMEEALIAKVNTGFEAFSNTINHVGFDYAGYSMTTSTAQGIADGTINIENAMRQAAARGVQAMRDELDMNSPSKKGLAIGANYTDSVAMGMYAKVGAVEKAHKQISKYLTANYRSSIYTPNVTLGDNISAPKAATKTNLSSNVIPFPKARSAQAALNRFTSLSDDSIGYTPKPVPIESIRRMETAAENYHGDSYSIEYHAAPITVNGSGLGAEELKTMIKQLMQEDRGAFEDMIDRKIEAREYRKVRMANA